MKKINTGGLSFAELRDEDRYYVDKTLLIKDVLDFDGRGVYLFTRPRRFGKTTNLSMLDAFFNMKYEGNTWFDDLAIAEHHQFDSYKNGYPVISLDLKISRSDTFDEFIMGIRAAVLESYRDHDYLFSSDSGVADETRYVFETLKTFSTPEVPLKISIRLLSRALRDYHGRGVIILIDEYDRAVSDTFGSESHRPMMDFLGEFLGASLKSNDSLQMAYVTGVMQIAKESIFSGLNNVKVNNVFSDVSDERFGFTESEVERILKDFGHTEKMGEAKEWYDGYRFGNAEVYNPFSIMSYVSHGFKPEQYWIDSGSTSMITDLLWNVDSQNFEKVVDLVTGGRVETRLDHMLTYGRIMNKDDHLFSLMALSGYLRAVPIGDGRYETSIPNNEVRMAVENLTSSVFPVDTGYFGQFVRATIDGDAAAMEETFQDILLHGNYLNLKENAYEVIMMTLMHSLVKRYNVRTEHKSGFGRTDIVLKPRNDGDQYRIFELKVSRSADRLESDAKEAIEQIHRERYHLGMPGEMVLYGISFYGNTLKVLIEKVQDGRDNNLR